MTTKQSSVTKKWGRRRIHHHVFNTLPNIFSLVALFLIFFALIGVKPLGRRFGVMVRLRAGEGSSATGIEADGEVYLGLLSACYKPPGSNQNICTPPRLITQLNSTLDLAGTLIRRKSFPDNSGDVAPLVLTWLLLSMLAIPPFIVATLPAQFPKRFAAGRLMARRWFTGSMAIQGTAWIMGFTTVLSLNEEVRSYFCLYYNKATARFPTPLNVAESGDCVLVLAFALAFQMITCLATLVCRETAPTVESDMFKEEWNTSSGASSTFGKSGP